MKEKRQNINWLTDFDAVSGFKPAGFYLLFVNEKSVPIAIWTELVFREFRPREPLDLSVSSPVISIEKISTNFHSKYWQVNNEIHKA